MIILEINGLNSQITVCRELTKKFEEHIGENINEVLEYFKEKEILGEITIVIKGVNKTDSELKFDKSELKKDLLDLINLGLSLSKASKYLAKKHNLSKSRIYNLILNSFKFFD